MCGRTACTLNTCDLRKACSYLENGRHRQPKCHDNGQVYKPSHNFCPTDTSLVLVAGSHVKRVEPQVLVPMIWGMIPPWHSSETHKNHGLTTHNCRLEGVHTSRLYKKPLGQGRRCVIVCSGFYEWQTTKGKGSKMPYFIHSKQPEGINVLDSEPFTWSEEEGWKGPTLLRIAGLFDVWKSVKGEELYSYSMITSESDSTLSWLHHRQPAFLETDEQVSAWLDNSHVDVKEALNQLRAPKNLSWYPVSTLVNNAHNKDTACSQPFIPKPLIKSVGSSIMSAWLKKGSSKRQSESEKVKVTEVKKVKQEISNDPQDDEQISPGLLDENGAKIKLESENSSEVFDQEEIKDAKFEEVDSTNM